MHTKNEPAPQRVRRAPFLVLRLSGLCLTIEHPPRRFLGRLLALLITLATGIGVGWQATGR